MHCAERHCIPESVQPVSGSSKQVKQESARTHLVRFLCTKLHKGGVDIAADVVSTDDAGVERWCGGGNQRITKATHLPGWRIRYRRFELYCGVHK